MILTAWLNRVRAVRKRFNDAEKEIEKHKADIRQSSQAIQSGARIVNTYAGAIEMIGANNAK